MNLKTTALFAALAVVGTANAAYIYTGTTITENFDGINVAGTATQGTGIQFAVAGTGFDAVKVGGSNSNPLPFAADNGGSNAGGLKSYGATGSSERALGSLASGTNVPGFGFVLTNQSNAALLSVTISFTAEFWRSSTSVQNILTAAWGTSGSGITASDYLTSTGMTNISALNVVGPAPVASNGLLDGNDPLNQAPVSATITFGTPLAVGQSLFVRWQDFDDPGNDAGLAIDDLSISAQAVPEPATMVVLGAAAAAALAKRKRK